MKICRKCDAEKPVVDFYADKRSPDGLRHWCKECWNTYSRTRWADGRTDRAKKYAADKAWRTANPDKVAEICRRNNLKRNYGISTEEYDRLVASQRGGCAVCGSTTSGDRRYERLVVDHDHETGRVRGALCSPCNLAIGHVSDDPNRLLALAAYLIQHTDVLADIGTSA